MRSTIAFVGAGPTTLYTLSAFLESGGRDVDITVFESEPTAGPGSPYRSGWNDPVLLANIASIEIPPVTETLSAWLRRQDAETLATFGLRADTIDDRGIYPRVVLGRYLADQLVALVEKAAGQGVSITVRSRCRVADVSAEPAGMRLSIVDDGGPAADLVFDQVVLATGHQWPAGIRPRDGYHLTPWPSSTLARIPAVAVGILGSSLTAIDAVVALAMAHGDFVAPDTPGVGPGDDGALQYRVRPGSEGPSLTMMSRRGLLPEADFFSPLPPEPPAIMTPDALADVAAGPMEGRLDRAFALFGREMALSDPEYAREVGLETATPETFATAYFARRGGVDPFDWAAENLAEARRNMAEGITIGWRYALLRLHEVFALIVPHLDAAQFDRFNRSLKPVFVDSYGAVPHRSISRLLALHRAGRLQVIALGETYSIDRDTPLSGAIVAWGEEKRHFPVFIEATGQRALSGLQFPFLSLLSQGLIRDEVDEGSGDRVRGIAIDDTFRPVSDHPAAHRLFCLGLPFIMGRHPFIQGITSSHRMGQVVGRELVLASKQCLNPETRRAPEAA